MRRIVPLFLLIGCQASRGDVRIEEVRVESRVGGTSIEIDVVNKGPAAAWVHTWPFEIAATDAELIVGLHTDEPGIEDAPNALLAPVIHYVRLAPPAHLLGEQEHTITLELPNEVGPIDERVALPDVPEVTVEVAWHDDDPGALVEPHEAPAPDGFAIETIAR